MFTVNFKYESKEPLYQQLYEYIKNAIIKERFIAGEKLPSKRKLALHLQLSNSTVENAYAQLSAEGYISSVEKKGYFVKRLESHNERLKKSVAYLPVEKEVTSKFCDCIDLQTNAVDTEHFPFSVWTKLMRDGLREDKFSLLEPGHPQGDLELRKEIVRYLKSFRNMDVSPQQVVLGAGMEYLLGLITELFTQQNFALENPCYPKLYGVFRNRNVLFDKVSLDEEGICIDELKRAKSSVVFLTPSRHFPLGTVTSANRRMQLLQWAGESEERYIIEDDYDSEYRYHLKPIPPLYSISGSDKVIYINTFTRTLAPSLRIGYIVLPERLINVYKKTLLSYSCTVSRFEQMTLRRFMQFGHYERHLNRMRIVYRMKRDVFLKGLSEIESAFEIKAWQAGLHFLVMSKNKMKEKEMIGKILAKGVKVYSLSDYYLGDKPETHTFIAGYGGVSNEKLEEAVALIVKALK